MTFQYNSADSSLFLLLDWFLEYSRSYDVYLCESEMFGIINYPYMIPRKHRDIKEYLLEYTENLCYIG